MKDLVKSLLFRIASGEFPVGSKVPSCRSLAASLGVSHSMVNRAYMELVDLGVLRGEHNKSMVVQQIDTTTDSTTVLAQLHSELSQLIHRAFAMGLSEAQIQEQFANVLSKRQPQRVPVAFIECHAMDTKVVAQSLQSQIPDAIVSPLELDTLSDQPGWWESYSLITTTMYHLSEVESLLPPDQLDRVVALHHGPSQQSMLQLARLPRQSRVLVVAKNSRTSDRLAQFLRVYGPDNCTVCVMTEQDRIQSLLSEIDVVVCTHSSEELMTRLAPAVPLIGVDFRIQPDSVIELTNRVSAHLAHWKV